MRVYGYAAEILGLSPYWQRRPRLQKLMVVYEAFAADGQVVAVPGAGSLSTSWTAVHSYFSQYLQARGQRQSALGPLLFTLEICAAKNSELFEAVFEKALQTQVLSLFFWSAPPQARQARLSRWLKRQTPRSLLTELPATTLLIQLLPQRAGRFT